MEECKEYAKVSLFCFILSAVSTFAAFVLNGSVLFLIAFIFWCHIAAKAYCYYNEIE